MSIVQVRNRIHKKYLVTLFIIVFVLLGLAGLGYLVWSKNLAVVTTPQSALVSIISGSPEVSTDGQNFHKVTDGEQVTEGSTVRTDSTTRALLVFSDNSVVTLDFNSQIKLAEVSQSRSENSISIIQQLGKIFSQVEKIVGVKENYEVNAKGVIAAVRGTKFGSGILENGDVKIYVTESTVQIFLADDTKPQSQEDLLLHTGKQLVTPPDQGLSGDDFTKRSGDFASDGSDWDALNICLSKALDGLQPHYQTNYNYIQFKYQQLITACKDVSNGTPAPSPTPSPTPTPTPTPNPTPSAPPAATMTGISDNGDYTAGTITCNWSATNVDKYSFAIGTNTGYTDTVSWLTTTSTSYTNSSLALTYATKYFCTVLPTGPGGSNGWKSTDGIVYDPITGSFRGSSQSTYSGDWNVYDSATYNDPTGGDHYNDINGYYMIKCTAGKYTGQYFQGGADDNFSNTPSWVQFHKSSDGAIYFSSDGFSARYCTEFDLSEKLVNDHTGHIMQQL